MPLAVLLFIDGHFVGDGGVCAAWPCVGGAGLTNDDASSATAPAPGDLGLATRVGAACLFAVFLCLRLPEAAWKGRFYAEEGEFFFAYAWHMPWRSALFHTLGGYLNIVASGATLLDVWLVKAGWLSLESAPYFTQAVALAFQTAPAILILGSRGPWLRAPWMRILALALIATPPLTEQVWLQTLHSQFELALAAGIVLATETGGGRGLRLLRIALLTLGPLCGPAAIVMLPFFGLRALVERNSERWAQTGALALGAALQLGLFYSANAERSYHIDPVLLGAVMFVRHVLLPVMGPAITMSYAQGLRHAAEAGATPWLAAIAGVAVFLTLALASLRRWREPAAWLLMPAVALAAVSYYGAIHGGPRLLAVDWATRYSFVPQALTGLGLLALAASHAGKVGRYLVWLPVWLAAIGLAGYFRPSALLASGPDWRSEVAAWRADPRHRLASWPQGAWLIDLEPTDAQCADDVSAPNQPDFCDSYWEKL